MTPEDISQIEAIHTASEQRITATIGAVIAASEERTGAAIAERTGAAIAASEERTGAAIAASEERTGAAIAASEERTAAAIAASEERAAERARDMQTEILRGLEAFARGNFARFHSVESNQTDINIRMAALEERVLYLETRRPPQ